MIHDYNEARDKAQAYADQYKCLVRLRGVSEFGQRGYRFNMVPRTEKQFGRDLEGELVMPSDWAVASKLGCTGSSV